MPKVIRLALVVRCELIIYTFLYGSGLFFHSVSSLPSASIGVILRPKHCRVIILNSISAMASQLLCFVVYGFQTLSPNLELFPDYTLRTTLRVCEYLSYLSLIFSCMHSDSRRSTILLPGVAN